MKENAQFKKGVISTLAGVFKHGQREQMMDYAHTVLRTILTVKFHPSELLIVKKPIVKLIQRIGESFIHSVLSPNLAHFHIFNYRSNVFETSHCHLEISARQQIISSQSPSKQTRREESIDFSKR